MVNSLSFAAAVLVWAAGVSAAPRIPATIPAINYNRDIRPMLAENCYACHGPDAAKRKAGLRLDLKDDAVATLKSGDRAIVPGDPEHSSILDRLSAADEDDRMPPAKTGKHLTPAQIALIRQWIQQGAPWQGLWSLVPPKRSELPDVSGSKAAGWPRNAIDRFILARLEKEGLAPSAEAAKAALIRRVTLDLTGLPPTPVEIDAFLADSRPDAYERVVDRLLDNPHYGERMALEWLDAARFADTHGYQLDTGRDMTRWRDGVIASFNRNQPFDQFTVEQLAGDLLPDATQSQRIATGFNRNHRINFECGAIPEEAQTAYVMDRVNTTATVFMGLTVGCAQCHDHKYDPITQKEYYQLYAFFNNVPEQGLDGAHGNAVPIISLPTTEQSRVADALAAQLASLQQKFIAPDAGADAAQELWEKEEAARAAEVRTEWSTAAPYQVKSANGATLTALADKSVLAEGKNPDDDTYTAIVLAPLSDITAVRLELLPDSSLIANGPGRSENGNLVLSDVHISTAPLTDPGDVTPAAIKSAAADFSQAEFPVEAAIAPKREQGWGIAPQMGKPHAAIFELEKPLHRQGGTFLVVTLGFHSKYPRHAAGRFRISVTNAKEPRAPIKPPPAVYGLLFLPAAQRSEQQKTDLRDYYRTNVASGYGDLAEQITQVKKQQAEVRAATATSMVMQEMDPPRPTHLLLRGQYDQPGAAVTAAVPACLPPLPAGAPLNRLGLARWLVSPDHPLTARVIVNRFWQIYFGTGIVKTSEDFGTQGEWPSHPELLDWLATEFIRTGWDVKGMQRLIVTSAVYRQSSAGSPELAARDPENRLLARGPRLRLPAEAIRDQALAISGLLNPEIGGASVLPYQPAGFWEELGARADGGAFTAQVFVQSHGKDLYRRSLYTFWKRNAPPPTLGTFDAPERQVCTVRRPRTNTPLQALALLNDPTYVEASRKLAERMLGEAGVAPDDRIAFAFRLATARPPREPELAVLRNLLQVELATYRQAPAAARKLLDVGESPRNEKLDPAELAAYTVIASTILNLDETIMK